jgi:hypothetical protein
VVMYGASSAGGVVMYGASSVTSLYILSRIPRMGSMTNNFT